MNQVNNKTKNGVFQPNKNAVLSGLKVIDFGHYIAGPMIGMILAEQGADVISIIPPNRDSSDPLLDAILQKGKQQLVLDLKDETQKNKFIELIKRSDVLIDNYAPEALKKMGIHIDEIKKDSNPGLIYCKILPYPDWNKKRNEIPGYEAIPGMEGFLYERPMKSPYMHSFPVGSVLSALYGACAIIANLYSKETTGLGEKIEVNLFESDLFAQILQILVFNGAPRSFMPLKMVGSPFMGVWKCKGERYIYLHITIPKHNADILELMRNSGFEKEIEELDEVMTDQTREDPSLVSGIKEAREIKEIMAKIYLSRTADQWEDLLGKDFCCIKIRTLEEWVEESLKSNNQDCAVINDPIFGELTVPGAAVVAGGTEPKLQPRIIDGVDVEKSIEKWKKSSKTIPPSVSNEERAPLDGVKVFDLSRVIAGPFSARVLAEFGADVISIQRPKGLGWALSFHVLFNSGKKSVTLDFSEPEGKEKLFKFLKDYNPHVFVQNYRSLEFSKEIGMDYETINEIVPGIVYTNVNGYGIEGEWQNRPAFEQVLQAVTGIQMEYVQGKRPKIIPFAILDMGAGLLSALSSLLGLYNQKKTGNGGFCHAHMTSMAMLLQITGFVKFQNQKLEILEEKDTLPFNYTPEKEIYSEIIKLFGSRIALAGPKDKLIEWLEKSKLVRDTDDDFEEMMREVRLRMRLLPYWFIKYKLRKYKDVIGIIRPSQIIRFVNTYKRKDKSRFPLFKIKEYPGLTKLPLMRIPIQLENKIMIDLDATPQIGQDSEEYLAKYLEDFDIENHLIEYPTEEPLVKWLFNFVVWGVYALRSGNI